MVKTCVFVDAKKADWYIEKGLGTYTDNEKTRVRLKFEPKDRPQGDAGKYYLEVKDNCCVVCGKNNSYLRKYVVPHDYRKHFPEIFREHQSHDILLMCVPCHKISQAHDFALRQELAELCNAPINAKEDLKEYLNSDLHSVKSACKALLQTKHMIPESRVSDLKRVLVSYFKTPDITNDILKQGANLQTKFANSDYNPHGKKVVDYFMKIRNDYEGIIILEKMWRKNFCDTMNPKYLPALWSIDHKQEWKFKGLKIGKGRFICNEEGLKDVEIHDPSWILSGYEFTNANAE